YAYNQMINMTHQHHYNISGVKDSMDLQKIEEALLQHPDVSEVKTTLEPATATVTVQKHIDISSLQNEVSKVGNFELSEKKPGESHDHVHQHKYSNAGNSEVKHRD